MTTETRLNELLFSAVILIWDFVFEITLRFTSFSILRVNDIFCFPQTITLLRDNILCKEIKCKLL